MLELTKNFYHQELLKNKEALNYLQTVRKISFDTIKKFQLGLATKDNQNFYRYLLKKRISLDLFFELKLLIKNKVFVADFFQDGFIIPVYYHNYVIHFYKNNYHNEIKKFNPKYRALPNLTNTNIFFMPYGFNLAKPYILQMKKIIIHEGFFDLINCFNHGIKNVVGLISLTIGISQPMINFLKENNITVIIGFDNDATGLKQSQRIKNELTALNISAVIKTIPFKDCKDADDVLKKHGFYAYQKIYLL
ncbi:toprim domain-containing protein ['Camptotheca acuminata' phytoplasma]|uniref:toprim domain-containing protein n=1 Tax='Camptotheca acuminata' phytoplasma TaxID=3239192 RepID=UPI003519E547